MFLGFCSCGKALLRFPRVRGDVPWHIDSNGADPEFSPRARGCSAQAATDGVQQAVFPACAGMFLWQDRKGPGYRRFPRIRGDVPARPASRSSRASFSPHTRGCSSDGVVDPEPFQVFPAYAGMFLRWLGSAQALACFPRIRGDVPFAFDHGPVLCAFSPHTRGCSLGTSAAATETLVFPAYAGMFRVGR